MRFNDMSRDVIVYILVNLPLDDLFRMGLVSKIFNTVVKKK